MLSLSDRFLARFARDTRGSVTVEFAVMMPLLVWGFMALFVYFDGYRESTINLKAAYTISDIISRETNAIDDDYIDSMQSLFDFLTRSKSESALRVTILSWNETDARYYVDWSVERGMTAEITNDTIMNYQERLPVMADADRLILVETASTYDPVYQVGMDSKTLKNFIVTRPRFAPLVVWSDNA